MRNNLLLAALAALSLQAAAIEVNTTAGALHEAVTDLTATSLTVTGTIDARDFKFMVDSMPALATLDLSSAQIEAYTDLDGIMLSSVTTYDAHTLPHGALMGSAVRTIVLPEGLKAIGQAAFAGCTGLATIDLPASVTAVGDYAFSHTGLTAIVLPAGVTTIGQGAFARCPQLTDATVHSAIIGAEAFMADGALSNVTLGDEVTAIGPSAFSGCTSLQAIGLGSTPAVATIGREAFAGSGLQLIDLTAMPQLTSIGAWAFAGTPLQSINIPATVTSLGEGAFYYTRQLTQATVPAFGKVEDFTFAGNTAATYGELLPEGTERIGDYAFYADSACTHFVLPSTITYIGTRAMAGMTALEQLDVLGDVALLGDSVWAGIYQPAVRLDTRRDNDVSDLFALAAQWQDFHILLDYLLGDVNSDTRINVRDITTTVDYILERDPAVFVFPAADVQTDKLINVRDVTGLTDIILDEDYSYVRAVHGHGATPATMPATTDRLVVPDASMSASGATIEVQLDNAQPYNAIQFDVVLPGGYRVGNCRATGRLNAHLLASGQRDGYQRIVAYSVDNAVIAPGSGTVVQLTIEPDGEPIGESYIALENVIFADQKSDYSAASCLATFDSVTGVDDLAATACKVTGGAGVINIECNAQTDAQLVAINGTSRIHHIAAGTTAIDTAPGVYVVIVAGKSHKVVVK